VNERILRTGKAVVRGLAGRANYHVVRGMADAGSRPDVELIQRATPWSMTNDYVRNGTLALLCRELATGAVAGDIAELGVFRGDFAYLMSEHLPDRDVHLFDTFSGFDDADVAVDAAANLVDDFIDFSPTSPEAVRARFADPGRVHLHVGYFPATTAAIDPGARFALVSIDADLYAPVLAGLRWFHERLTPGGYILVHDYNNDAFAGAKKAVAEFCAASGAAIVPIPDWGGTAVLAAPR
jgi:O-methyltransferase